MSWLDVKYIRIAGVHLQLFKEKKTDLWAFRCPVCGDSQKDKTKTRGYIYNHNGEYKFKCHNCGSNQKFSWFLKWLNPELHKEYRVELFKENRGSNAPKEKPKLKTKFNRRSRTSKPKVSIAIPKQLEDLQSVSELPDDHFVVKYVDGRAIPKNRWSELYWCENMRYIADKIGGYQDTHFDNFPRLLLPFINQGGVLTHIQGRAIGDKVPKGSRFYTLEVEEDTPKVFGMNRIDDTKPVKVVEGPIDSFFLSNCTGMGGSDVPWHLYDPNNTIFVWDNEPRSPQIVKRMKEAVKRGFSVCVWGSNIREKDINDMVKAGRSIKWMDDYITTHAFKGLKARMAITQYEK